ncbi:hypothetical protein TYRP_006258 [Tyrophagus putrescentiae]|nr:hypothetical protein TYRP_006258 [Tyrophagus putrescentiae]
MAVLSRFASDNLPDLPLLALMSQMSANDRLAAYQVCPRWGHRVLEVNKTLKVSSLTIAVNGAHSPNDIHSPDPLGSEANETHATANEQGNLQLLTSLKEDEEEKKEEEEGKGKEDGDEAKKKSLQFFLSLFPRQSQWNCLEFKHGQLTPAIVRQIMAAFPGITELTFLLNMANNWKNPPSHQANFNQLFTALTSDEKEEEEEGSWKAQLRTLRVINRDRGDLILEPTFYEALCLLPALRNLTLYDVYLGPKQQLAVLGQLEQVTLSFNSVLCYHSLVSSLQKCIKVQKTEESFFSSLLKCFKMNRKEESDPPSAAVLPQVSLPTLEPRLISELLFKLKLNYRRAIVCLATVDHSTSRQLFRQVFTGRFSRLVSVSFCATSTHLPRVFSTLSRFLPKLRHLSAILELKLTLENELEEQELLTLEQPLASVQALHLKVSLTRARLAHDNLRWLNIGQLMPNLKALHLNVLECRGCGIGRWWSAKTVPQRRSAVPCLRELLQIVAHSTGLPPRRITYQQQRSLAQPSS